MMTEFSGRNQDLNFDLLMEGKRCFLPFDDTSVFIFNSNTDQDNKGTLELYQLKHGQSDGKNYLSPVTANQLIIISTTGSKKEPFYLRRYYQVAECNYLDIFAL